MTGAHDHPHTHPHGHAPTGVADTTAAIDASIPDRELRPAQLSRRGTDADPWLDLWSCTNPVVVLPV